MNVVQRFLLTLVRKRTASEMDVRRDSGSNLMSSRIIIRMWLLPLAAGMNFSMRSEKNMQPTLSLFCAAEKASTAAISVIRFFLVREVEPN